MKKLLYLLIISVSFWALYSCTPEEDDIFNESAANRMTDQLKEYKSILTDAPNGWLMQYYPDNMQAYGGYNYLISFGTGDSVVIAGDIADPETTQTSLYSLISNTGPVLTFNTYNQLLHFFSEPKNSSDTDGYAGDYEFIFMEVTTDRIVLKGTKTGNKIVMTQFAAGQTWKSYLESIASLEETSTFGRYKVYLNDQQILTISTSDRNFIIPDTIDGIPETYGAGFIYTPEGIQMYKPLALGGAEATNFTWNSENKSFECKDGVAMRLEAYPPTHYRDYEDFTGNWEMAYGTKKGNVQLIENVKGKSYTLKGLILDINVEYNKMEGGLIFRPQYLGIYNGYYAHLCVIGGGYISWSSNYTYVGYWDEQTGNLRIVFQDSGTWDYPITSIVLAAFDSETASGSSYKGNLLSLPNITLTKRP